MCLEKTELYIQQLQNLFWGNNITPEEYQIERLANYADLLAKKNDEINLVSRKDIENIIENHIFVSSLITEYMPAKATKFLDIGTGGGLPGIPLAIMKPLLRGVLVDSIAKKISCVQEFKSKLKLGNIVAENMRVESPEFIAKYKDSFDLIVSRATVPYIILCRYSIPLIKSKAYMLALKGGNLDEEIDKAQTKWGSYIKKITVFELAYKPTNIRNEKDKKLVLTEFSK